MGIDGFRAGRYDGRPGAVTPPAGASGPSLVLAGGYTARRASAGASRAALTAG
jgi:hypothetical protein